MHELKEDLGSSFDLEAYIEQVNFFSKPDTDGRAYTHDYWENPEAKPGALTQIVEKAIGVQTVRVQRFSVSMVQGFRGSWAAWPLDCIWDAKLAENHKDLQILFKTWPAGLGLCAEKMGLFS